MILKAAQFAEAHHRGQIRRFNGTPYIWHPMRVAGRASMLRGANDVVVAAAWLHDVVEDCAVSPELIDGQFGPDVRRIVLELTNPSKNRRDLDRSQRKAIDRKHLSSATPEARAIKLLDRIDNLSELIMDARENVEAAEFLPEYRHESGLLLAALAGTHAPLEAELARLIG